MITQPQDSARTGGILIGILTAILGLIIFAPVPNEWKIPSISALSVIGILNLIYLTGTNRRIKSWNERREREGRIKHHPEFQSELYRMNALVYRVLFDRSSDHSSLAMLEKVSLGKHHQGHQESSRVDEITKEILQTELNFVIRSLKMTGVLVAHDIDEAVYLGDRILVLSAHPGRIVEEISVDLPEIREPVIKTEERFTRYTKEIREKLNLLHPLRLSRRPTDAPA